MTTGASTPTYPARPRRSRVRTFLPLGIAAWLVLEIWLLSVVAGAASGFVVFLLLVAGFVLGSVVIKRAGRRAFQNLNEALQRGGAPSGSGSSGNGLMMLGGLLLMIPGLLSDAVGLLLLIPPVQKAVGRYAERTFDRRIRAAVPGTLGDAFQQARMQRPDGKVVQGEVIVRDEPGGDSSREQRPPLTR
ncbi:MULTISPECIES: FxsA family membrane protein [Streptomyces]|uniref:Membrane protein n=1 Tax=Streptomyces sviceus (strain ATCC 29083 / DSM 924 / JCM 4929 / NBRC 13980 / NCIMB 11184 / NRRL 5439 / UC 5370) TaxID=463191 RepID=B5I394_STRX2|nr:MULTISPECIES: FxsA family membrane protein [Streptomyces]EDY59549.1 membrane protein [Streptomyces sviceus ATCC 29083]MYT04477.1 FxsA family protein [Streptomyces sp. SID5470]